MRFSDKVVSHLDISNSKGRRLDIKEPHDHHHHRLITITYEAEEGEDSIERRDENKTLEDDYMWQNYDWNVTDFGEFNLSLQLKFSEPDKVSASAKWDTINMKVDPGNLMFMDAEWQ